MKVATSILSIKDNIKEKVKKLDNSNTDYIHLDIMDGVFVPNKTWDYEFVETLTNNLQKPLDVHLMVKDLDNYIRMFSKISPEYITFHIEAVDNIDEVDKYISMIKTLGIKVGLSVKPNTSIDMIKPYLQKIDLILVMSVEPGKGGQEFIEESCIKIKELKQLKDFNNYDYVIEVDGGINKETASKVKMVGADMVVSGSYITNNGDCLENIDALKSV